MHRQKTVLFFQTLLVRCCLQYLV